MNAHVDLLFEFSPDQRLIFTAKAVNRLSRYAMKTRFQKEAGGILLGKIMAHSNNYIVEDITTPKKTDSRRRYSFFRSEAHNHIAVNHWKRSGGRALYLGLWHSHPEQIPKPSTVDYDDWSRALAEGSFEGDSLAFVIVGTEEMRCWKGALKSGYSPTFEKLQPVEN